MSKCYFLRTLSNVAFVTKEILPCLALHNKLALEEEEEEEASFHAHRVEQIQCPLAIETLLPDAFMGGVAGL